MNLLIVADFINKPSWILQIQYDVGSGQSPAIVAVVGIEI